MAQPVTSVQYLYPNQVNGGLSTAHQALPPRTPAVRAQPQQPPTPPQSARVPVQQPSPTPRVDYQAGARMDTKM
jgi:hypothetical protein